MVAMLVRPGAPCFGLSMRSMLNFTAAASKGSPLWNFKLRLSLNCQVVSLTTRHDSARLPSSWSVLRLRRRSVSKIWRSGSWAFLSQCMCQSSVAASPDCTTTTGFGCAWAGWVRGARHSSIAPAMATCRIIVALLRAGVGRSSELLQASTRVEIGIERVSEGISDEVDGHDGHEERGARKQGQPVARVHVLPALGQHAAPGRDGDGHAETEERQPGLGENRAGDAEGGHDHEGGAHIGQDVAEHNAGNGKPERARGFHVGPLAHGQ